MTHTPHPGKTWMLEEMIQIRERTTTTMSTRIIVPATNYRIKALTQLNLEKLCTAVHRHGQDKLAKYGGLTVTDEVSAAMTGEAVEGAETLRLALITAGHERARDMDLSGIEAYYKRNVARP